MKKYTFFIIAFLGCLELAQAQTRLSLVPRVGATWGNMLFTNTLTSHITRVPNPVTPTAPLPAQGTLKHGFRSKMENQVTRIGFLFGADLNIAINNKFSVQPGLAFVQKGARYIDNNFVATIDSLNNFNKETHILLNYIEMPVLALYHFSLGEKFPLKGYLGGGMSAGMFIGGKYRTNRVYVRDANVREIKEEGKFDIGSLRTEADNTDRTFDNRFEFGVIAAVGLEYPIGPGSLIADVRYNVAINNMYSKGSSNIPAGFDNVSKNRVAQVTLGYKLPIGGGEVKQVGKEEEVKPTNDDTDGDGVPNADDACPTEAGLKTMRGCPDADGDGVTDKEDGCPAVAGAKIMGGCPDTDGDGVSDKDDACAEVAGAKIFNGCPDTDGDGIADKEDACPSVVGGKAMNGCPDTDADGIADKDDKCPNEKGVPSLQGCPEPVMTKEKEKEVEKQLEMDAKMIQFETGSAVIKAESYDDLDKITQVMKVYPSSNFKVEGHTDNVGNAAANKTLSQSRADAVKKYITDKGIAGNRIDAVGYGQEKPKANNATPAGRQENRRVEIHIAK